MLISFVVVAKLFVVVVGADGNDGAELMRAHVPPPHSRLYVEDNLDELPLSRITEERAVDRSVPSSAQQRTETKEYVMSMAEAEQVLDRRAHATREQQELSPLWTQERVERRTRDAIEQFRADALRIFQSPIIDLIALAAGGFGIEVRACVRVAAELFGCVWSALTRLSAQPPRAWLRLSCQVAMRRTRWQLPTFSKPLWVAMWRALVT